MNTDIVLMYNADVEMHGGRRGIEMDFTDAAVFGQQMGGGLSRAEEEKWQ